MVPVGIGSTSSAAPSVSFDYICNWPWVMSLHRAHVSSLTGLMCLCARLGLSSTALVIVSSTSN
jgi:hypothetical protein